MNKEGWLEAIRRLKDDPEWQQLMAESLVKIDQAKQVLRDKGYGWTGLSILETVKMVPQNE